MCTNPTEHGIQRRFITREFAETIRGKAPHPYLRLHDPVQRYIADALVGCSAGTATSLRQYLKHTLPFWREVSLTGIDREKHGLAECCALLFEAAVELALDNGASSQNVPDLLARGAALVALQKLERHLPPEPCHHDAVVRGIRSIQTPSLGTDDGFCEPTQCVPYGEPWFWAGVIAATDHALRKQDRWRSIDLSSHPRQRWGDGRLHSELIRRAPRELCKTPKAHLMDHPIIRLARLHYVDGTVEQSAALRFLNARAIQEGFVSEENCFGDAFLLGQWVRDARRWATATLHREPELWPTICAERGAGVVETTMDAFSYWFGGADASASDDFTATIALMSWARALRGFEVSSCRGEAWEFVVVVIDMALWLGWMFPQEFPPELAPRR